jgi:hypothetical protein
MKMKIVVRKGDKRGGGGDFEIQVFSTAPEPRLWTLENHEKRTKLSLKLAKKEEVLCAERRNAWFSVRQGLWHTNSPEASRRPNAYQHVRRASTRLYACRTLRISRGQQCGATCKEGWELGRAGLPRSVTLRLDS